MKRTGSLEDRASDDAMMGRLRNLVPGFVRESLVEDGKLAECEKCAQVADHYIKSLSNWTAADDYHASASERAAVIAAVEEVARRIRKRNHERTQE